MIHCLMTIRMGKRRIRLEKSNKAIPKVEVLFLYEF